MGTLDAGTGWKKNGNNTRYQFWLVATNRQDNHPVLLEGKWLDEKLEYIHQNPVEVGWVNEPEEYFYSSARNYAGLESPLKIMLIMMELLFDIGGTSRKDLRHAGF